MPRIDGLGAAALEVSRAVAALADPTVPLVERAVGARFDRGLAEALDARILELDGQRLRFTHPLLGTAVAGRQTPARRRALNARLADVVPSAEERARHLALATSEPDGDVASIIERAARMAHVRGATVGGGRTCRAGSPAHTRIDVGGRPAALARRSGDAQVGGTTPIGRMHCSSRLARQPTGQRAREDDSPSGGGKSEHARVGGALSRGARRSPKATTRFRPTSTSSSPIERRFSDGVECGLEHAEHAVRAASRAGDAALRCRALAVYSLLHFNAGRGTPG